MKPSKPKATDRTIDIFTGLTRVEEALPKVTIADTSDTADEVNQPENIEQAAERWRDTAIYTSEHLSKHFGMDVPDKEVFRLTQKDGWLFLEKFSNGRDGKAYHWSGVMFKEENLYELTSVLVKASKTKQERDNG